MQRQLQQPKHPNKKGLYTMGNFPDIPKSISDYLYEEEGNITRNKLLMVGSLSVVLSVLFALEAEAGHGSHKSHKSHTSHSSGVHTQTDNSHNSHSSSSHTNSIKQTSHSNATHYAHHVSHSSHRSKPPVAHGSHNSHQSHTNGAPSHTNTTPPAHTNHSSHSNSFPKVLTPKRSANSLLPESVDLIKNPSIPNLPDTATSTFSISILSSPTETPQE